jgi:hypothetical protein
MKIYSTAVAVILFSAITPAWSEDAHAIYGTWKADLTKSTQTPPNRMTIHLDGEICEVKQSSGTSRTYRIGAASENNQPAMRRVDARTLEVTRRTISQAINTTTYTVSPDGRQLTETIAGQAADGKPLATSAVYHRVAGSPLSVPEGTWESDPTSRRSNRPIYAKFKAIPGGIEVEFGTVSYAAKFDGTEAPFKVGATGTVAVQRQDARTILVIRKGPNNVLNEKWEVSEDGRSLMLTSVMEGLGAKTTSTLLFERQ